MDVDAGNRWKEDPQGASTASAVTENHAANEVAPAYSRPGGHGESSSAGTHSPSGQDMDRYDSMQPQNHTQPQMGRIPNLILANSWFASLIVHLVLLILLSMVSYSLHHGAELELELASSPADDSTFMIESDDSDASDGKNLDEEMEQLLAASEESAVFEINSESFEFEPQVSLENMNGQDDRSSDSTAALVKSDRKVGNGNQAQFFGIQATGKNFVFIVDSSGSMTGTRWKNAVRELRNSLTALQENQRFYVIFFDHQTHLMFQGRVDQFRKSRRLKMINATDENLDRVNNWLRRVDLGTQTRPRISFDYGMSLQPDAIFFLTDGEFNDGTYEYLMGIAAQSSNIPTIHTVAFGNRSAGRALEEIAERFKGKYRFVR